MLAIACTPGDAPRFRRDTPALLDADPAVPLSRALRVTLDRPARLEVAVTDSRGERSLRFDDEASEHLVPLVGTRAEDEVSVVVTAVAERGSATADPVEYRVGALPARFPVIDVLVDRDDLAEPGLRVLPIELVSDDESLPWVIALDDDAEVVWLWDPPFEVGDLRVAPSGSLYALARGVAWQLSPLGEVLGQWGRRHEAPATQQAFQPLDVGNLSHEWFVLPEEDRFLSLYQTSLGVSDYPCRYSSPDRSCGPDTIVDLRAVEVTREGTVLRDLSLAARLDPFRIGFDALDRLRQGRDWAHGNAIVPLPTGGWLVSLRHQDALVALDEEGLLKWILADPSGWSAMLEPWLLAPIGEPFSWPYHAHGPTFDEDGVLWVFDNGNHGRTPYTDPPGRPERSRVVGYRIDEEAGTVEQVTELVDTATGPLFSRALGRAGALPETGNLLGVYGMATDQGGVSHASLGFGSRVVRLVEWTRDGEVAWDVRLRSDRDVEQQGWRSFRAVHAPSLYAAGVETWP